MASTGKVLWDLVSQHGPGVVVWLNSFLVGEMMAAAIAWALFPGP